MSRLSIVDPAQAEGQTKELLAAVQAKLKSTPNMIKVMANSPAVLSAYLSFSGALGGGALEPKIREGIALLVAQTNGCGYCVSAHSTIGKITGLKEGEITGARLGRSHEPRAAAALAFSQRLLAERGHVTEEDFVAVRSAGFDDATIGEIIAHVALNVFTNYFNSANEVVVDFPKVSLSIAA